MEELDKPAEGGSTDTLIQSVYDELRNLAAYRLNNEQPGQTLQATALVHEAYLRLNKHPEVSWDNPRHFFSAAAESMRRILIERARQKNAAKRGSGQKPVLIDADLLSIGEADTDILDLHDALNDLAEHYPMAAELVQLRFFAGLTIAQVARILEISPRTVANRWDFAKAWLYRHMKESRQRGSPRI